MILAYIYVMILPSLIGSGPPTRNVMFHPVWLSMASPIMASVAGNLSIALKRVSNHSTEPN